jgi:hypothetical protein
VPDSIIDRADDIELVDLTPEDLIARLNEGKVYVPDEAERAIQHYFSPGNLTALRELALRRTAQRVDAQLVDYMRAHRIDMLTIGQYLQPTPSHLPVLRYVHPDGFAFLEREAYAMGFVHAAVGALVRSSYHADAQAHGVLEAAG